MLLSIKMALSGHFVQHSLWSNSDFTRTLSIPQLLKANHEQVKKLSQRKLKIQGIKNKSNCLVTFSMLNPEDGTNMSTLSPSDTIRKFYSCINKKDMNQLALLIAEDCFYDDFSYIQPFQGRKVPHFFSRKHELCFCFLQRFELNNNYYTSIVPCWLRST